MSNTVKKIIKNTFRFVSVIGILLFILIGSIIIFRGPLTKFILLGLAKRHMGAKASISKISVDLNLSKVHLKGVTFYNPQEFEEEVLAYLPNVEIHYSPLEYIFGRKWHFYYIGIVKELKN